LQSLPTEPATIVDGVFLSGGYVYLECELDRLVDGFGENSLVAGRIVAAHVAFDALRSADRDDQALLAGAPLPVFLYPQRYGTLDRSVTFPYHEGFER
jgi:flavin reductase (DIM6/NTAB) family NADH-FMN oxidoreductase RutF